MRIAALLALAALTLAGCEKDPLLRQVSETPQIHGARLDQEVGAIAESARPGVLGVGVFNLESAEVWAFNGDRRFPLRGSAGLLLAAAVLAEVDAGRLALDDRIVVEEADLSPPPSPIAAAWPAVRSYTVRQLLAAALSGRDNTAHDVLLARIGGPGALTAWLAQEKVVGVRIDRYQREIEPQAAGLGPFRAAWRREEAYRQAIAATPMPVRQAAAADFLRDPRDTATPRGMLGMLAKLDRGELLSRPSTALLRELLRATPTGRDRLAAGFPPGSRFANVTGTTRRDLGVTLATDDAGIVTLPDGRHYAVAAFLSGAALEPDARDAAFADLARALTRGVQ